MKPRRQHKHMPTECAAALIFTVFVFVRSFATSRLIPIRWNEIFRVVVYLMTGYCLAWSDLIKRDGKNQFLYIIELRSNGRTAHTLFACINSINNQTCTRTIGMCARAYSFCCSRQHFSPHLLYSFHIRSNINEPFQWLWCIDTIIIFSKTHSLWQSGAFFSSSNASEFMCKIVAELIISHIYTFQLKLVAKTSNMLKRVLWLNRMSNNFRFNYVISWTSQVAFCTFTLFHFGLSSILKTAFLLFVCVRVFSHLSK